MDSTAHYSRGDHHVVPLHHVVHERESYVTTFVERALVHDDLHRGTPALQLTQPVICDANQGVHAKNAKTSYLWRKSRCARDKRKTYR